MSEQQEEERAVALVVAYAPLLSGNLDECLTPGDESCVGGMASISAYLRYFLENTSNDDSEQQQAQAQSPSLVLPFIDKASPFVQMHPLKWALNRLVFRDLFQWNVFLSSPALLTQNSRDYPVSLRDLSDLQTLQLPLLLTNAAVPPANSWHAYTRAVHFDAATGLAVLAVDSSGSELNVDQIDSAKGVLDFVARLNGENGCVGEHSNSTSLYAVYANSSSSRNNQTAISSDESIQNNYCWVPIVTFADVYERFVRFVEALSLHEHPPAFIFDVLGTAPEYETPTLLENNATWVHSFGTGSRNYNQHRLFISSNNDNNDNNNDHRPRISRIDFREESFQDMPAQAKDFQYVADLSYLRRLANQAVQNDPVVGATSAAMPVHRDGGTYQRCAAGECEMGNLFVDALRWFTSADVAFITSGGLRGGGWPAGEVRVSNLWEGLPFPNTECTGRISGLNLFNVFNFSTSVATFEGELTDTGGDLLQIAGMRITYNTELSPSRLLSVDVWDEENGAYLPLERLRIYSFATDSYLCGGNEPFPDLLVKNLVIEGEQPGVIGTTIHQDIVADYMLQLNTTYDVRLQGKMTNDTSRTDVLDFVQTQDSCVAGTYWSSDIMTCATCPADPSVHFLQVKVEFEGVTGSREASAGQIDLVNSELFIVSVNPKSVPSWVELIGISGNDRDSGSTIKPVSGTIELQAGEEITLHFKVVPASLNTGTAVATVLFGVFNGGNYLGCTGQDVGFDVFMRVTPSDNLNQLGGYAALGFTLAGLVSFTSLFFIAFVYRKQSERIVKTMQPVFLVCICAGVLVMGLSMIPLSIDDGIASEEGADMACMSVLWLFSIGFTIAQSALFSKLWRINKLFDTTRLRRMQILEKDVVFPGLVLFGSNFTILLIYTLVDPFRYERDAVPGEEWNTYGHCTNGKTGRILFVLNMIVNLSALFIACYQAFKARNISDEFSESKSMAFALFSWVELVLLALPAIFLVDDDNPAAKYFMIVALIFAVCESMLLFIFVPMLLHLRKQASAPPDNSERMRSNFSSAQVGRTRVSGVDFELPKSSELEQYELSDNSVGRDQPSIQAQHHHKLIHNQSHSSPHNQRPSLQIIAEGGEEESVSCLMVSTEESSKTSGGDEANGGLSFSVRSEELSPEVETAHDND